MAPQIVSKLERVAYGGDVADWGDAGSPGVWPRRITSPPMHGPANREQLERVAYDGCRRRLGRRGKSRRVASPDNVTPDARPRKP
jgi:hypothetical protein